MICLVFMFYKLAFLLLFFLFLVGSIANPILVIHRLFSLPGV